MYYKLTNQNLQTHLGFQWVIGEWKETSGKGPLCTDGWLHCYTHPLLAVFLNPIHACIKNPKLFEIEVSGKIKEDYGLKVGFTKMRLTREIPLPQVTDTQRVALAILCSKEILTNEKWLGWADRTEKSAHSIYNNTEIQCIAKHSDLSKSKPFNLIELAQKAMTYN